MSMKDISVLTREQRLIFELRRFGVAIAICLFSLLYMKFYVQYFLDIVRSEQLHKLQTLPSELAFTGLLIALCLVPFSGTLGNMWSESYFDEVVEERDT